MKVATLNMESEGRPANADPGNLDLSPSRGWISRGIRRCKRPAANGGQAAIQEALDKMLQRGATLELADLECAIER